MTDLSAHYDLETTPKMRKRVKELLDEAKMACYRPLFDEISNGWAHNNHTTSDAKRLKLSKSRRWETLLADAVQLLPFMTTEEHAVAAKCAAIYLLGFLNPMSTGSDFFTLRSTPDDDTAFIDMELEERLENTSRFFQANEFGEVNVCTDVNRERAFQSFLKKGLAPFLSHRAAHANQTDVLHLIAMAIAPQLNTDVIGNIVAQHEEKQLPAWVQAHRLMGCLHAHSFQLHYAHRMQLVKIVTSDLILPDTDSTKIAAGAVPHLLAALHTFARHTSMCDAHVAHEGMVRIATQTRQESIVREIFYLLLSHTIEDTNQCKCPAMCPHASRGNLLKKCVATFNAARHKADSTFTEQASMALSHSIQEEMGPWIKENEEKPNGACLLSSLLQAAEPLFYFVVDGDDIDTSGLLEMSIQLLCHPDTKVRKTASSLLSVAFSYMDSEEANKVMGAVLNSIRSSLKSSFAKCIEDKSVELDTCVHSLEPVIVVSSRVSYPFAHELLILLIKERSDNWKSADRKLDAEIANCASRLISTTSSANAMAALRQVAPIRTLLEKETSEAAKCHLAAALLSTRQAFPFGKENEDTATSISATISENKNGWRTFKLARHALATGNFAIAKSMYDELLLVTSTEESFLWISALSKVAEAESNMLTDGAMGIPAAVTLLQSAVSYIKSTFSDKDPRVVFQVSFLQLRLDFLDLAGATRLVCRETRLSGTVPKDTTRVGVHLVNTLKSWGVLGARYHTLYQQHGLVLCSQSRTTLRSMSSVCQRIGAAGMKLLSEAIHNRKRSDPEHASPKGDKSHPTIRLLDTVNNSILPSMDKFVEPAVRATALIEMLEGVHRSPTPFPRRFTVVKRIPAATLRISLDPSQQHSPVTMEEVNLTDFHSISDSTTMYPGMNTTILASGSIPDSLAKEASKPFSQLLLWCTISFIADLQSGHVDDEEENEMQNREEQIPEETRTMPPVEIPLPPSNAFVVTLALPPIKSLGIYRVDYQLGCRDIGCGEWQLPLVNRGNSILVRVSRRLGP